MKKVLLTLATAAMVLTSCGTMGLGTSMGAMVGGTLGSIAGDATGGRYGASIGGMIGSVAGMAVGAAIEEQQYRERMEKAASRTVAVTSSARPAIELIDLDNFIYTDSNNNDTIEAGEKCQISFDVINTGDKALTNITPILELMVENKGIRIGNPTTISKLSARSKVTYSVPVNGTSHLKNGEAEFRAYVVDSNGNACESREFTLPTMR